MSIILFLCASSALALTIPEDEHNLIANTSASAATPISTAGHKSANFTSTYVWPNSSLPSWMITYDFDDYVKKLDPCNLLLDCGDDNSDDSSDDEDDGVNSNSTASNAPSNSTKRSWARSLFKRSERPYIPWSLPREDSQGNEEEEPFELRSNPYPGVHQLGARPHQSDPIRYYEPSQTYGEMSRQNRITRTEGYKTEHEPELATAGQWAQRTVTDDRARENFEQGWDAPLSNAGKEAVKQDFGWGPAFIQKNRNPTLGNLAMETYGGNANRDFSIAPGDVNNAKMQSWNNKRAIGGDRLTNMQNSVASGSHSPGVLADAGGLYARTHNYMEQVAPQIKKKTDNFARVVDGAGDRYTTVPFRDERDRTYNPGPSYKQHVASTVRNAGNQLNSGAEDYYRQSMRTLDKSRSAALGAASQMEMERRPSFYDDEEQFEEAGEKWKREHEDLEDRMNSARQNKESWGNALASADQKVRDVEALYLNKGYSSTQIEKIRKQHKWGKLLEKKAANVKGYQAASEAFNSAAYAYQMHSPEGAKQRAQQMEDNQRRMQSLQNDFSGLTFNTNDFSSGSGSGGCKRDGTCTVEESDGKPKSADEQKSEDETAPKEARPQTLSDPEEAQPKTPSDTEIGKPAGQEPATPEPATAEIPNTGAEAPIEAPKSGVAGGE